MNHPPTLLYLKFVMPAFLFVMAGWFFFIALKILITRRPLILSQRWLFAFICLAFLPQLLQPFIFRISSHSAGFDMITWLSPLMFVVLIIFFWFQMKGFTVFCVSEGYLRDALLSSVALLGYSVEETMSRLKIKETGEELQISIQGWMGVAQLKSSRKSSNDLVKKTVRNMNDYFKITPGIMSYMITYFYLIIGFFMMAMAVGIFLLTKKI